MKNFKFIVSAVFVLATTLVFSAPAPPPGGTTGSPACWPPPCVPIDNGLIFLVVAGILFAAKKFYDFRKAAQPLS